MPCFRVAAGVPRRGDLDRARDRNAVPVAHLDALAKGGVGKSRHDVADDVFADVIVPIGFHAERQGGSDGIERRRQQVIGVKVAQRREDVGHLRVEGAFRCKLREPVPEQPQPLQRVDRMHGPLQGQMRVAALEHNDRLLDDERAFLRSERHHGGEEFVQRRG